MKIIPLAADSMGSRSMATFVETRDGKITIDPGAGIAPLRFGLSPHSLEQWQLKQHLDRIRLFTESSQAVVITSYHPDHFFAARPEWMKGKVLFLKNPNQKTTPVERKSAFHFLKTAKTYASQIHFADGRAFSMGATQIRFSPSCFNGQNYFIETSIHSDDESFLFSSCAAGPVSEEAAAFLLDARAETLYLDGPVTYLQKEAGEWTDVHERMRRVARETRAVTILLDHHSLRDLQWKSRLEPFFRFGAENGVTIRTAAEYRGEENTPLEARRNLLHRDGP
jgi:predicted metallo-beta-lactamase superfamily hydrolase